MSREIVFILEPDAGRVTIESSRAEISVAKEIERDLGQGCAVNCARPQISRERSETEAKRQFSVGESAVSSAAESVYLYRLYHRSTVDGPGRRSVVQFAGCSIRCANCYIPETHRRENGTLTQIDEIIFQIDERSGEHDGVTVLGGEPFDQTDALAELVERLKVKGYHVAIYSGYTLEELFARKSESVERVLANTDLLIDGAFVRELARDAGEYRGSSNQRLIFHPMREAREMIDDQQKSSSDEEWTERLQTKADFYEFIGDCLDEGFCPTGCPEGCTVEPDGVCPHDYKSVALEMGLI
jgi:anaerobic ribonucleoside-triphosphate reductase activating protein